MSYTYYYLTDDGGVEYFDNPHRRGRPRCPAFTWAQLVEWTLMGDSEETDHFTWKYEFADDPRCIILTYEFK